ncbi:MAG: hypothetical protein AAGG08_07725, partial [Actinomycetota bacterium]
MTWVDERTDDELRDDGPDDHSLGDRGTATGTDGGFTTDDTDPDRFDADHLDERDATPAVGLGARVAARAFRRPLAWWRRPWDRDRVVRTVVTSSALTITTVIMMLIVHFNPLSPGRDLIFDATTPTGGDMGAHVWAPAFLRDHLLPNFQISGWSMDWYGGIPLYLGQRDLHGRDRGRLGQVRLVLQRQVPKPQ